MATDDTATGTPAYIPWRTFTNTLDTLAQHMPNRIDRSAFPGQSGTGQNQLLIAFRFFGLIDEDGKPTPVLLTVAVADETARKSALRKLVEEKYADLFALNLMKTTPSEFAEQMTKAGGQPRPPAVQTSARGPAVRVVGRPGSRRPISTAPRFA